MFLFLLLQLEPGDEIVSVDSLIAEDVHICQLLKHLRLARDEVTIVVKKNSNTSKSNCNNNNTSDSSRNRTNGSFNGFSLSDNNRATGDSSRNSPSRPHSDSSLRRIQEKVSSRSEQAYPEWGNFQLERLRDKKPTGRISPEKSTWRTAFDHDGDSKVSHQFTIKIDYYVRLRI